MKGKKKGPLLATTKVVYNVMITRTILKTSQRKNEEKKEFYYFSPLP